MAVAAAGIGCGVFVLDEDRAIVYRAPGAPALTANELARAVAAQSATGRPANRCTVAIDGVETPAAVARVEVIDQRTVTIVLAGPGLDRVDEQTMELVISATAVALLRERAAQEKEARLADCLLHSLLSEQPSETSVMARAAAIGLDLSGENSVLAAVGGTAEARVTQILRASGALVFVHDRAVLGLSTGDAARWIGGLAGAVAGGQLATDPLSDPRVTFAGPHRGIDGARRALQECLKALDVLRAIGRADRPIGFEDLGIWTILAGADREQLARFRDGILGEVIEHDSRRRAQLLPTLRALVHSDFQWRAASEELAVHPNTVRYRMSLIRKLAGLDLNSYRDQMKADIALRIADVLAPIE